jgi:hypothetical protein
MHNHKHHAGGCFLKSEYLKYPASTSQDSRVLLELGEWFSEESCFRVRVLQATAEFPSRPSSFPLSATRDFLFPRPGSPTFIFRADFRPPAVLTFPCDTVKAFLPCQRLGSFARRHSAATPGSQTGTNNSPDTSATVPVATVKIFLH